MLNYPTVRIRSHKHPSEVAASWIILPSQADDRMKTEVFPMLDDLTSQEPSMDWRIETRGEDLDWHSYA